MIALPPRSLAVRTLLRQLKSFTLEDAEDKYLQRGTERRSHQYRQIRADRDYTRFSFFPRTIKQWNLLPSQTCSAASLETFKINVAMVTPGSINSQNIFAFLFSSFYLSLFLLICLIFIILPFFPSRTQLVFYSNFGLYFIFYLPE